MFYFAQDNEINEGWNESRTEINGDIKLNSTWPNKIYDLYEIKDHINLDINKRLLSG